MKPSHTPPHRRLVDWRAAGTATTVLLFFGACGAAFAGLVYLFLILPFQWGLAVFGFSCVVFVWLRIYEEEKRI